MPVNQPLKSTAELSIAQATIPNADTLVSRALALRDTIRAQAEEAEGLGRYTPAMHEAFLNAGFYHMLTPKMYGGYETDLRTFAKVIIEVGRGDPGTGWCLCLGHGHALTTAARWNKTAQDQVFNDEAGYFRASHSLVPAGKAFPVEGGYRIQARSPYQSGIPYSTHATVNVQLVENDTAPGAAPRFLQVLIPAGQFQILDDWGGDKVVGMRASGSNTVVVDDQFVPSEFAIEIDWLAEAELSESEGTRLHHNPMYLGVSQGFLNLELVSCIVGAARAAIDEFMRLMRCKAIPMPPYTPRIQDPMYQRDLGTAVLKANAAEALVLHAADVYTQHCADAVNGIRPFDRKSDIDVFGLLQEAGKMACEAVETLFRSAGSSAATKGQPMQRYMRDVLMYRTHTTAQFELMAQRIGAVQIGERNSVW
ncbi:acyl-CoA dehydrogenase family protein [Pseudomonas sp. B26140]|uniref:acyl-CoA dehydrogenase family protein n=1 Tax=Pseudomonas sp. B26140 TaxID=3235112 RepID=UPI0037844B80